ncbi:MAG: pilus assembly protein PilM [Planctomycetia bacterium]|nr:MAG: pilus assembly protein PilM [Planctomycetia bacterium]TVL95497.1 MAG: hypothetical protein CV082_10595 [Candidatus Brocadia sp. BL1]HQU32028.1 pilus assembly protein PilM [Candidatus Brocadia sapporoensis]
MKLERLLIKSKFQSLNSQKLSQVFKNSRKKSAWGIDINECFLRVAKITQVSQELLIDDLGIIEIPQVQSESNDSQSADVKKAIQAFLSKHNILKEDKVVMSISGQSVLPRFINIPPVEKKQLKGIVNYEAKQQIPFDLKDIVWDYQQLTEKVADTNSIEVGLFASKRATLDQLLANISPLETRLTAIQAVPLAIYNLISFDQQINGLTIIINSETESTDLIIVDGLYFWLRSIPTSKVDADLVKEIQRSMEYYKSLMREASNFQTILLTGNKFNEPNNVKFITDNFTYEVKIFKTLNNVKLSSNVNATDFNENILHFTPALGLALQGIGLGRIKINLLPPERIKTAEISKKKPYAIASLGCLALSLLIQYSGLYTRNTYLQNSETLYQKVLQNIKELEGKYKNAETHTQTNKSALDLISSVDPSRFIWLEGLDKLVSLIPNNVSLSNIQSSWIDEGAINSSKKVSAEAVQPKKTVASTKPGPLKKLLLMGIKGESQEPSMRFIEEHIIKPVQSLTLFDQKVAAFKNVEIVPGSSRQVERKNGQGNHISFEIRWIVKSIDEIHDEENSVISLNGTSTPPNKS